MAQKPKDFDPRKYLGVAREAMKQICLDRLRAFGTEGYASKIKPVSMEVMEVRYSKGELAPQVR
jgi:fructose-bisphosphate aldolase class II